MVFKSIDTDDDGRLSTAELSSLFSNNGSNEIKEIMKEVDKNNDGFISPEEFNQAMMKLLENSNLE